LQFRLKLSANVALGHVVRHCF